MCLQFTLCNLLKPTNKYNSFLPNFAIQPYLERDIKRKRGPQGVLMLP